MIPNPNFYQLWKKEISSRSFIKVSSSRPDAWYGHGTLEKSLSKLYPSQKQWSRFVSPTSAVRISVRYKKRCQKSFLLSSQEGKFCRCQFLSGCSSILKPWTVVWRLVERTGTFKFSFFQLEGPDSNDLDYGHGLLTPNEGINQRNLKIWADVADKICFVRT